MAWEEKGAENRDNESDVYITEYKDAIAYGTKGENYGCLDFIDDLIVDVTVIHDNFSKTLKNATKLFRMRLPVVHKTFVTAKSFRTLNVSE